MVRELRDGESKRMAVWDGSGVARGAQTRPRNVRLHRPEAVANLNKRCLPQTSATNSPKTAQGEAIGVATRLSGAQLLTSGEVRDMWHRMERCQ